jgi:hypothetical protein
LPRLRAPCGRRAQTTKKEKAKEKAKEKQGMCEGCGLKQATYGLASEGTRRWCVGCGKAEGAVRIQKRQMCEGSGLKVPNYGLASEGKRRWCAGCGAAKGAVLLQNRRVKIQSRMQQQRQELESCAPCAAAGVATDGMGTVPANKTDQAIFLEPLPKLPPKPRVGKDIEKNARRMATWQRERGEVGLAREERKRVAANYKCMSKKQRFEFIAEPARLPKAAVIQGCGITWRSCVAATRRWCAGCGVVEEVVHL